MIDLKCLDRFPNQSIEDGVKILDKVYWFTTIGYENNVWHAYAGETLIFRTDSEEAFNAFLYGLAITYVSFDQAIVDFIHEEIKKWVE